MDELPLALDLPPLHPAEEDISVILDMAPYLPTATLDALEQSSTNLRAAIKVLKTYPQYAYVWKRRFEEILGISLAPDASPGSTSWKQKCALVELPRGVAGLLFSYEEMDVALGYSMVPKDRFDAELIFVVAKALSEENKKILAFLLQVEHKATTENIEWALYDNGTAVSVFSPESRISFLT